MNRTTTRDRTAAPGEHIAQADTRAANISTEVRSTQAPEQKSPAQLQRERAAKMIAALETRRDVWEPYLRQSRTDPDLFLAGCRRALGKNPALADCDAGSFINAAMDVARLGLMPDGKKAALTPFKKQVTAVIMYEGMLDVIYRTGITGAITCQVIYEGEDDPDILDYDLGTDPYIKFRPPLTRKDSQPIIGAFAVAQPKDGGKPWAELLSKDDLRKIGLVSKATNGPRKEWPGEMARKGALRRMAKFLPKTPEIDVLMRIDEQAYIALPENVADGVTKPGDIPTDQLLTDDDITLIEHQRDDGDGREVTGDDADDDGPFDPERELQIAEAMLRAADEADVLESRIDAITNGDAWGQFDAEQKARLNLVIEEARAQFDTGAAPELAITAADGKRRTYKTAEEWKSAMLVKMASAGPEKVGPWWEGNLDNIKAAIAISPAEAGKVIAQAVVKNLPGAKRLVDEHGPF